MVYHSTSQEKRIQGPCWYLNLELPGFQNCEKKVCFLSHSVYGNLLRQPEQMKTEVPSTLTWGSINPFLLLSFHPWWHQAVSIALLCLYFSGPLKGPLLGICVKEVIGIPLPVSLQTVFLHSGLPSASTFAVHFQNWVAFYSSLHYILPDPRHVEQSLTYRLHFQWTEISNTSPPIMDLDIESPCLSTFSLSQLPLECCFYVTGV